jgi:phage terminase large subunit-like protein
MKLPQGWKDWDDDKKRALLRRLRYDWTLYARPDQLAPDSDWLVWLLLAGRGAGKTRSGAEYCRKFAEAHSGSRIGIICPTYGVVRDVAYEGESGLLNCIPPDDVETYNRSLHQLTLKNGSRFTGYSGSDPERLRGPQHHLIWCEELAAWQYLQSTWDMAQFGLRLGELPRAIVTTTPRPLPLIKDFLKREAPDDVVITRASTFDNAANLPRVQLEALKRRYAGTYLGMQELQGLLIDDIAGALWTRENIEVNRVLDARALPPMSRVVVGVDPAASSGENSDMTGVVVVGRGVDGHGYVFADRSLRASPDVWGTTVVKALVDFKADRIVAERNNGGEMVTHVIRTVDPMAPTKTVWASKGKFTRAEPVAALYEQNKMHHVGIIPALEDEMCTWIPGDSKFPSPNRVDALVWACTEVVMSGGPAEVIVANLGNAGRVPIL